MLHQPRKNNARVRCIGTMEIVGVTYAGLSPRTNRDSIMPDHSNSVVRF